jgi:hypothetical protein
MVPKFMPSSKLKGYYMKFQRISMAVTAINMVLMIFLFAQLLPAKAERQQNTAPILRGRGLEIVDSLGKVRASITMQPAVVMNGKMYPATILLRLIDSKGEPKIKLGCAENGGGLVISNNSQDYIQLLSNDDNNVIRIKTHDGKEQVMKP